MFKIAVCDDDQFLCTALETLMRSLSEEYEVEVFGSGLTLFNRLQQGQYFDLIFLDLEMPELNGVEVGKKIREILDNQTIQIVFMSVSEAYYRNLFEIRPNNFLLKPLRSEEVISEIEKAKKLSGKYNKVFKYKKASGQYAIPLKDIVYFESQDKVVHIRTNNHQDTFYNKLNVICEELQNDGFIQIHKSILVNRAHIIEQRYEQVVMSTGVVLDISQSRRKAVRALQFRTMMEEL